MVDFENTFQIEMLELADRVKEILQFKKKRSLNSEEEEEVEIRKRNGPELKLM